jgi:hypothetical protein
MHQNDMQSTDAFLHIKAIGSVGPVENEFDSRCTALLDPSWEV